MCLVCFVLDLLPFASRRMLLLLSWWSTDSFVPSFLIFKSIGKFLYWCSINSFTIIIIIIASSTPMIAANIELVEFTFCLFNNGTTALLPNFNIAFVWLRMSLWTTNDTSMLNSSVQVAHRYCITLANFKLLFSVGSLTVMHRYLTATWIQGLTRFAANYKSCSHTMNELTWRKPHQRCSLVNSEWLKFLQDPA